MKIVRYQLCLSALVALILLTGGPVSAANGWNPFGKDESKETPSRPAAKASPLEALGSGTKKFFSRVKETLSLRKPEEDSRSSRPANSRRSEFVAGRRQQPPKKQNWLGSLLRRDEPEVPKSLGDWMSLKRQDP